MTGDPMEIINKQGKIKISHDIVMTIARQATADVKGIVYLTGGLPGGITEILSKKTSARKGVKVENEESQININISVVIEYGSVIPEVIKAVQEKVKSSVEYMADVQVGKVNVYVQDVKF